MGLIKDVDEIEIVPMCSNHKPLTPDQLAVIQERHNTPNRNASGYLIFTTDVHQADTDRDSLLKHIDALESDLNVASNWIQKAAHHNYCMRLDCYDERDHGCTCGKETILEDKP